MEPTRKCIPFAVPPPPPPQITQAQIIELVFARQLAAQKESELKTRLQEGAAVEEGPRFLRLCEDGSLNIGTFLF